jgi:hypothetical protein
VGLVSIFFCGRAAAQSSSVAESLFEEGKRLMDAGDLAAACPKLQASLQAERAPGTLLRLALCHEQEGRLSSAWAEYRQSLSWAERDGSPDRIAFAQEHLNALAPKLSFITIKVADATAARLPGLRISLNGTALARAAWNTPIAVDPGRLAVEATADDFESFRAQVSVIRHAQRHTVVVPLLRRVRRAAPPPPTEDSSSRTIPLIVASGGVAALGVGTYFGIRAIDRNDLAENRCPASPCSDRTGADASADANRYGWYSNVAVAAGVAALGVSVYLWFGSSGGSTSSARLTPVAIPSGSMLSVSWNAQ